MAARKRVIPEGVISASLLVLIVVASAIGAIVGLSLGGVLLPATRFIAIASGFVATVVASIARYKVVFLGAHAGVDEAGIPMVLVVNAAIASIAGSLAAHDVTELIGAQTSPALLGAFAGLLSAVLMAMLMITYHSNPNPSC